VQAVVLLTGALILLLLTNPKLTLVVLPILPMALIMFMVFGQSPSRSLSKCSRKLSALNTILQENLAGIKVSRPLPASRARIVRFDKSAEILMEQQITVMRIFSFLFPVIFLIANLGQAAVLYFGGQPDYRRHADARRVAEVQPLPGARLLPAGQLGFIISQMSQAAASANRVFEILDAPNEVTDKPGRRRCRRCRARWTSTTSPSATSAARSRCSAASASAPRQGRPWPFSAPRAAARAASST
jgi:ATP-binding cassette subfamily B multidrug efflux pump